jgi:hypothetical protein
MNYGERLKQRDMAQRVKMRQEEAEPGKPTEGAHAEIETRQEDIQVFEFQTCIADHNLEDAEGQKLDFRNKMHILKLDADIAQEIEIYIDRMNVPQDVAPLEKDSGAPSNPEPPKT